MGEPLIPILAGMLKRRAMLLHGLPKSFTSWLLACRLTCAESIGRATSGWISRIKFPFLPRARFSQSSEPFAEPDLGVLNCRVQLTRQKEGDSCFGAFTVQIAGSIYAATERDHASVRILIADVTDGTHQAKPVHARVKQWQVQDRSSHGEGPPMFCYRADLGKLPDKVTTLSAWTAIAHVNLDWLLLPRKGKRLLQFCVSVLSREHGQELAYAECSFTYENPAFGYIDLQENSHRTRTLAVALALAVSAADNKLYCSEVEVVKTWAEANIGPAQSHNDADRKLAHALDHAVSFFQNGNHLDTYKVCKEIVEIAPPADRYDILDLCLQVAGAKGSVVAEELNILKHLASWLEVDMSRFRTMIEKTLPVNIHQVKDTEVVLGVTSDMNKEKTRRQLNKEYGKWNSRVTNADPEIQAQADQMLKLIAEARSQYVG